MELETSTVIGIVAGIIGGLGAGGVMLLLILRATQRGCPFCGKPLPRFRKPTGLRQMLFGGWTCPACGVELNGRAKKIAA